MNITKHEGKYYKEVKRVAKVGELIKIVDAVLSAGRYKDGSILLVDKECQCGCGSACCLFDGDSEIILQCEYVTLEPLTVMTDEPHPEIAEGSTFVVVEGASINSDCVRPCEEATLVNNDKTRCPYFKTESRPYGAIMWFLLSPLNVIDKYKPKQETVTIYGYDEFGMPVSEAVPVPGVSKNKFKSINPKPTTCPSCGQPLPKKRVYTAEQIQEAKDIVYRIMTEPKHGTAYAFDRRSNRTLFRLLSNEGNKKWVEIGCDRAKCSPDDTWNDDIGRMVAICKLTGEELPKWIVGD